MRENGGGAATQGSAPEQKNETNRGREKTIRLNVLLHIAEHREEQQK